MTSIDISKYPDTVAAFGGNEQRATVFLDRYSKKDGEGNPTEFHPSEMWSRVAYGLAADGIQGTAFFDLLKDFKFVPGGRILSGAGVDAEVTYYNCYVIPVETAGRRANRHAAEIGGEFFEPAKHTIWASDAGSDSRGAIFDTISLMVEIMSRGGGVGINWSILRPKGAYLKRVNGTTSGPVSWMDVASRAVGVVEQGGSRRGAAMFMLDDWHPDLLEFVDAKRNFSLITNANVSVCVSDAFMQAVKDDADWTFRFPRTDLEGYNSEWDGDLRKWIDRFGIAATVAYGTMKAREIWRKLAEAAWASGEPGVVFLDRYNKMSTGKGVERIISVNPCGEQGLGPYSVCNLGAMNLSAYVVDAPTPKSAEWGEPLIFDFSAFAQDVRTATRFLDRVVDKNFYFIPENEAIQKRLRRVGLGVMGLADALIKLGIRYGSPEAVKFTEQVFRLMKDQAIEESVALAKEFGPAPAYDAKMWSRPYLADYVSRNHPLGFPSTYPGPLRNLFLLTQAPTGTTSILAGVNSGIEPYFAFKYLRKDRTGEHWVYAPVLQGDVAYAEDAPFLVTSNDVTVEEHIAMQAAAQKYIDSSVSKTINGPNAHTVEDVEKAYTLAYDTGCKGVAYFRDGSGRDQVLYKEAPAAADTDGLDELLLGIGDVLHHLAEFERPKTLRGKTIKVRTIAGTAYVTVNFEGDRPVEVFVNVGKAGSDITELGEAIGRLASLALRKGATLGGVANQLEGIGGNGKFNKPLAHAIGEALTSLNSKTVDESTETVDSFTREAAEMGDDSWGMGGDPTPTVAPRSTGQMCPECQNFSVAREEGCLKCGICGWSAC